MYFSIIIPLYNKQNYVSKAIKSVLDQTHKDFELIIVNDGSTDNSLSVVQNFSDRRIKIIEQANQGVSKSRNNGVYNSKYDFIAFLDADDWWDKTFLETMSAVILEYPNAGIYSSNYKLAFKNREENMNFVLPINFIYGKINYFEVFYKSIHSPVWSSCSIVSKDKFLKVGGFNSFLKGYEDYDLWIRMACIYDVIFVNQYLAYYNQDVGIIRASRKILKKSESLLFNMDHLILYEKQDRYLKCLLDNIRLSGLKVYYVNRLYLNEVRSILDNVENYPLFFKFFYSLPPQIAKLIFNGWRALKKD